MLVELEGIEPSSKQGNHTLSTCLFQTSFSCCDKTWTTHQQPYLLKFHSPVRAPGKLFPMNPAPLDPQIRNHVLGAMSRSLTL